MDLDDAVGGVGHGLEERGQRVRPDPVRVQVERLERAVLLEGQAEDGHREVVDVAVGRRQSHQAVMESFPYDVHSWWGSGADLPFLRRVSRRIREYKAKAGRGRVVIDSSKFSRVQTG